MTIKEKFDKWLDLTKKLNDLSHNYCNLKKFFTNRMNSGERFKKFMKTNQDMYFNPFDFTPYKIVNFKLSINDDGNIVIEFYVPMWNQVVDFPYMFCYFQTNPITKDDFVGYFQKYSKLDIEQMFDDMSNVASQISEMTKEVNVLSDEITEHLKTKKGFVHYLELDKSHDYDLSDKLIIELYKFADKEYIDVRTGDEKELCSIGIEDFIMLLVSNDDDMHKKLTKLAIDELEELLKGLEIRKKENISVYDSARLKLENEGCNSVFIESFVKRLYDNETTPVDNAIEDTKNKIAELELELV